MLYFHCGASFRWIHHVIRCLGSQYGNLVFIERIYELLVHLNPTFFNSVNYCVFAVFILGKDIW